MVVVREKVNVSSCLQLAVIQVGRYDVIISEVAVHAPLAVALRPQTFSSQFQACFKLKFDAAMLSPCMMYNIGKYLYAQLSSNIPLYL